MSGNQLCEIEPTVTILMGTYNGSRYLPEQLESIRAQSYQHWKLIVSDDGSTDDTLIVLKKFQASCADGQVLILEGPKEGFAANFLSMVMFAPLCGGYFAFSDQDDVWLPEKIERALKFIAPISENVPVVYGSRTTLVGEFLEPIGFSPLLRNQPSFKNALAQNIAGGNTLVFNNAMLNALRSIGKVEIISHDWWLYLVVMAIDGKYIFDNSALILYRQHTKNLVGSNSSLRAQIRRAVSMFKGRYRHWMEVNINALRGMHSHTAKACLETLVVFQKSRNSKFPLNIVFLFRSGVRHQTFLGNCKLFVAALLNRI